MSANVDHVIDRILADEGGIADVGDGKGVTRFGQTPGWLADWGFVPPSNAADAAVNYEAWMRRLRLTDVAEIDVTVGHLVTDFAVHSGHDVAIKTLQRALDVRMDGVIGPVTLAAVRRATPGHLARLLMATRLRYLGDVLADMRTDRRKFARGWMNRVARQVAELP